MTITMKWDHQECTILWLIFGTTWTQQDLEQSLEKVQQALSDTQHPLSLVIDMHQSPLPPNGVLNLGSQLCTLNHEKLESIVLVSNTFMRSLFSVMNKLSSTTKNHVRLAATHENARLLCQHYHQSNTE